MRSIRFAVLVALSLILLPARLPAQNHEINQAGASEQRPAKVEEQIACTSYPEWTCIPTGSPPRPESAEERASRGVEASRPAATTPAYTSYPEWTWLTQSADTRPLETAADTTSRASADPRNGFLLMAGAVDAGKTAIDEAASALRETFQGGPSMQREAQR